MVEHSDEVETHYAPDIGKQLFKALRRARAPDAVEELLNVVRVAQVSSRLNVRGTGSPAAIPRHLILFNQLHGACSLTRAAEDERALSGRY
jgi:hypothetical protein